MNSGDHKAQRLESTFLHIVLILLLACVLTGCMSIAGTVVEKERSKIYIGVRTDITMASPDTLHWQANVPAALIFLPFDFVMDTLLLPYTIYYEVDKASQERNRVSPQVIDPNVFAESKSEPSEDTKRDEAAVESAEDETDVGKTGSK